MAPPTTLRRRHRRRQPLGQTQLISQITQHTNTRVPHNILTVTGHQHSWTPRNTLHLGSALLGVEKLAFDKHSFPYQEGLFADARPRSANDY